VERISPFTVRSGLRKKIKQYFLVVMLAPQLQTDEKPFSLQNMILMVRSVWNYGSNGGKQVTTKWTFL
jgi:hypothetical protein